MSGTADYRPLVAFTTLAIAGAGLVAATACLGAVYHHAFPEAVIGGVVLQAIGLIVSLAHLGRARRAGLAARGAGRSALSNEVIMAMLALASGVLVVALGLWGHPILAVTVAAGVFNALFLVSIGLVYRLRGQQTWQGFSVFTPLIGGCAFGAIAIHAFSASAGLFGGTLFLVALDALFFRLRWREVAAVEVGDARVAADWMARRDRLLRARFFLLGVVPFFLLLAWPTPLAALVSAAGLLVDRIGFYALAIQHTTEHEVAAIEDLLDHSGSESTLTPGRGF